MLVVAGTMAAGINQQRRSQRSKPLVPHVLGCLDCGAPFSAHCRDICGLTNHRFGHFDFKILIRQRKILEIDLRVNENFEKSGGWVGGAIDDALASSMPAAGS